MLPPYCHRGEGSGEGGGERKERAGNPGAGGWRGAEGRDSLPPPAVTAVTVPRPWMSPPPPLVGEGAASESPHTPPPLPERGEGGASARPSSPPPHPTAVAEPTPDCRLHHGARRAGGQAAVRGWAGGQRLRLRQTAGARPGGGKEGASGEPGGGRGAVGRDSLPPAVTAVTVPRPWMSPPPPLVGEGAASPHTPASPRAGRGGGLGAAVIAATRSPPPPRRRTAASTTARGGRAGKRPCVGGRAGSGFV